MWCETITMDKIGKTEKMEIETEIRKDLADGSEKTPHFKITSSRDKLHSDNHFTYYKLSSHLLE